ncbi:MAG: EF-Tu/IF-2/RF-3 family GTPase, partial [Gallicola sp.]|nr:EF-Tu/IF-2/RF-3 family GTPase [Gallicola sp.]
FIPAPEMDLESPFQLLISTIDYNEYIGRIGIGKIERGSIKEGEQAILLNAADETRHEKVKISQIYEFEGLDRMPISQANAGSIVAVTGIEGINIGDTLADVSRPQALEFVKISEPTISMNFAVNNGPFAGREGKFVTSRQIKSRLYKELQTDVSLKVEDTDATDSFKVSGRGELHLSVLIENMRREGFEFQVSKPQVLFKIIDDKRYEPMEKVTIDVSNEFVGAVIEKLGKRKGELIAMQEPTGGYARLEFKIPARGLIGYRQEFLTDTKGNGIMNSIFEGYEPFKGDIPSRKSGSIISYDNGTSSAYGLNNAQDRGVLFIEPGEEVYEGMIVGSSPKGIDLEVSVTKTKKQSN